MAENCLFCRIVSGEVPAKIVAANDRCIAFRDIGPQAPVHVLVIPRAHVASLNDVTDYSLVADMAALGAQVAREEGIAEQGYRLVFNTNAHGGQTVFHLHAHVLGGRPMRWPPG
jgi:histidine triad (HIT) family protein